MSKELRNDTKTPLFLTRCCKMLHTHQTLPRWISILKFFLHQRVVAGNLCNHLENKDTSGTQWLVYLHQCSLLWLSFSVSLSLLDYFTISVVLRVNLLSSLFLHNVHPKAWIMETIRNVGCETPLTSAEAVVFVVRMWLKHHLPALKDSELWSAKTADQSLIEVLSQEKDGGKLFQNSNP